MVLLTKYCPHCKQTLAAELFPKNKATKDGLHAYCLACNRAKQAAERARRGEEYREMRRRYRASENGKAAYARYPERSPWQKWAQSRVWNAIERGVLVKADVCQECGRVCKTDGHHDDYALPLEVRWLCRWCHQEWHRINGEAKNAGMHVVTNTLAEQKKRKAARMQRISAMRAGGMTQKAIAEAFGVTQATICQDIKRLQSARM